MARRTKKQTARKSTTTNSTKNVRVAHKSTFKKEAKTCCTTCKKQSKMIRIQGHLARLKSEKTEQQHKIARAQQVLEVENEAYNDVCNDYIWHKEAAQELQHEIEQEIRAQNFEDNDN